MAGAALEIQKAVVDLLRDTPSVVALVGGRIFDKPTRRNSVQPYVEYRPVQKLSDHFECGKNFDLFFSLDVWSRAVGTPEMTNICEAIEDTLHDADVALENARLILIEHQQTRYLDDPDGVTQHGIVEIHAAVGTT